MSAFRRSTLSDVARLAGVSGTTVSYILNGRAEEMRISADTQQRVRVAVAELGYRPNRSARSLRTRTTKTIGLITDFVASGMFASRMLSGANAAARSLDHVLVISETEGDPSVEEVVIDEMVERQVDGILYVTRTTLERQPPAALDRRVVMLNCVDPARSTPSVLPDERSGGRAAAEAILASGVRDEVYIVGEDPTPHALAGPLRRAGIEERMAEAGAVLGGVIPCHWAVEPAYDAVCRWLAAGHRPQGLICLNDRVAMGVYQALGESGLVVPDDVAVVSFDGSDLATWLRPRVTSVGLPFEQMGALAVRLLLDPDAAQTGPHLVPMPVIEGRSVRLDRPAR